MDLGAIARNYRRVQQRIGKRTEIIPVVKADAYGHGAVRVARRLEGEGARRFAVAIAEEGIALRRAGVSGEILLLNFSDPADLPLHRAYGLTPTLYGLSQAQGFAAAAASLSSPLPVHLKLDTGMGRLGVRPEDVGAFIELLRRSPQLAVAGTFMNFSRAEDPASSATGREIDTMRACLDLLRARGVSPGRVHLANSAGLLARPDSWFDAVRPGLLLYGVAPSEALEAKDFEPALRLETRVMSVSEVPAGTSLGYGGHFVTARASTIAALPIGYHDGFRHAFSGRVSVLLRGRQVPVVGAVSMDVTLVDATDSGAGPGERAICLGSEGGRSVTAWDLSRAAGTIPYEILCGISARVTRVYVD